MFMLSLNFTKIRAEMHKLAPSARLIAVTKGQGAEKIDESLALGHRIFGENRVQEAQAHWAARRADYPDLELHLIGPLQTNKVDDAVALFDVIHTVDRPKLVNALAISMAKQGRTLSCFIQVNTGAEDQKAGCAVADLPALLAHAQAAGLNIIGLMCVPPVDQSATLHFALLRTLAAAHGLKNLSMGMSGDYPQALALGATHIRIGSALFGERSPH